MNIKIIRGQNQIGGSIIEISSNTTKLILDVGLELKDDSVTNIPNISGLFQGVHKYDAVLISHYHGDHIGLLDNVLPNIPVYIGEKALSVVNMAREYLNLKPYTATGFLQAGKIFKIGDITVTAYLCDHSAFDSYMIHLECENDTILYTGDFRANGRKSFDSLLSKLPQVNKVIVEGTTLNRDGIENKSEDDLVIEATKVIQDCSAPVFVLMASTNIDRIVTMYKVAKKCKRIFAQDLYTALISSIAGKNIPNPKNFADVKVFMSSLGDNRYRQLQLFGRNKISRENLAKSNFIMNIRPLMTSYLEKLAALISFQNGILFYSMWSGYRQKDDVLKFLKFMEGQGVKIIPLHTSGHADNTSIDKLIKKLSPQEIYPIHTENAQWFNRYESDTIKVVY